MFGINAQLIPSTTQNRGGKQYSITIYHTFYEKNVLYRFILEIVNPTSNIEIVKPTVTITPETKDANKKWTGLLLGLIAGGALLIILLLILCICCACKKLEHGQDEAEMEEAGMEESAAKETMSGKQQEAANTNEGFVKILETSTQTDSHTSIDTSSTTTSESTTL